MSEYDEHEVADNEISPITALGSEIFMCVVSLLHFCENTGNAEMGAEDGVLVPLTLPEGAPTAGSSAPSTSCADRGVASAVLWQARTHKDMAHTSWCHVGRNVV